MSAWIDQIFDCPTAVAGGVVKRSLRSVERSSSVEELEREVRRRGYHMV